MPRLMEPRHSRQLRRSHRRGWHTSLGVLAIVAVSATVGCAGGPGPFRGGELEVSSPDRVPAPSTAPEMSGASRFVLALSHIQQDDFDAAGRELAELIGTCESGFWGRDAVLVLASLELDPRNAGGSASSAARLAARYLQDPSAPSAAVAETLYLLAVDLGGEPVTDPFAQSPGTAGTALSFENCDAPGEPVLVREIPSHPGPSTTRRALVRASAQRDAMAAVVDSLTVRAAELEAELERIRRLLGPTSIRGGGGPPLPHHP